MASSSINDLHDEVTIGVLSHLSAKQLGAVACVSKTWNRLISDDPAARRCLPLRMAGLFHHGWNDLNPFYFTPTHGLSSLKHVDVELGFLPGACRFCKVLDACNGLLLCVVDECYGSDSGWNNNIPDDDAVYIVCNPATREFTVLPAAPPGLAYCTGLAYDPNGNTSELIKVVRFLFQDEHTLDMEVQVYSSSSGSSSTDQEYWRSLHFRLPWRFSMEGRRPVYHKGVLHIPGLPHCMLKFDVEKEVLGLEEVPGEMTARSPGVLGVTGGVLHYVNCHHEEVGVKLVKWVLLDQEEGSQGGRCRWVVARWVVIPAGCFNILGVHPDVEVVFVRDGGKVFGYHLENGRGREMCVEGGFDVACTFSPSFVPLGISYPKLSAL